MANVTIVPPSPQVQTVTAAGGQQAQSKAALSLSPGSIVSGTIIGKDASGNFLLSTDQGTLSLQSNTPLTYNSDVVVQIGGGGNAGTTARIISVNGESFSSYSAPEPETSDTLSQSLQTQAATPTAQAPASATAIRATIVSAPTAEQALASTQAGNDNSQPVSGTAVLVRLVVAPQATVQQATVTTPAPQPAAGTGSTTQSGGSASVQAQAQVQQLAEDSTPANVAKLVAPQPAALQNQSSGGNTSQTPQEELATATPNPQPETASSPSSTLYATYTKQVATSSGGTQQTPSAPTSTSTSSGQTSTPENALQGQVTASSTDASTFTLQTPIGNVIIKADPAVAAPTLLPGTNVSIELPSDSALLSVLTQTPLSQTILSSAPASLSELASSWQSLSDIVNVVSASNGPAATDLLSRLPQLLGPDFVSSTAAFLSAIAGGNVRKLLGDDTIDTLRQTGRLDLLQKFTGEMNGLNEAYNAPTARQSPGWQPLFMPFVYGEEVQQARIYVKREPQRKGGSKDGKQTQDTRFVVEVDLSELGPMQMDGLVRDRQQSTMFDLIIRSRNPFSAADQAEIGTIYKSAAELTGFKGSVTFQVSHDFPVKPLDEMLANAPHGITV